MQTHSALLSTSQYPIFSFGCNCDGSNLSLFPCNLNLGVGRGMLLCPYLDWSEL
ncbi:unnamed protein product, partial [Vitis vinifera]|uniref:Uncharacterized protein n=1 Tax=Vitis vinifera TaxID=29760 RepID=D7TKZ4_VITVI